MTATEPPWRQPRAAARPSKTRSLARSRSHLIITGARKREEGERGRKEGGLNKMEWIPPRPQWRERRDDTKDALLVPPL